MKRTETWIVYIGDSRIAPGGSPMAKLVKYEGAVVVELSSRSFDTSTNHQATARALREAGRQSTRVIIDLGQVRYVEGELIGQIVRAWKQMGARPGDIVLIVDELQRGLFTAIRLDHLFGLAASRAEALRAAWPEPTPLVASG